MFTFQMLIDDGFEVLYREDINNRFSKGSWTFEQQITYLEVEMFRAGFTAREQVIANMVREEFLRSLEGTQVI